VGRLLSGTVWLGGRGHSHHEYGLRLALLDGWQQVSQHFEKGSHHPLPVFPLFVLGR